MAEVYDSVEETKEYYDGHKGPKADFPFNFYLMTNIRRESSAYDIKNTLEAWKNNLPEMQWVNWIVSDSTRLVPTVSDYECRIELRDLFAFRGMSHP
jgi:glycosidase